MGSGERIKQQYVPYWEWEDWVNGMWNKGDDRRLQEAVDLTGDHTKYGAAMAEVIEAWPRTMLNSLTNTSINRRAFLGHCAVCYKLGISEDITRQAWSFLTDDQRTLADAEAQKHIKNYEETYRRLHKTVGGQVLP